MSVAPTPIKGYSKLNEEQIGEMNVCKEAENLVGLLWWQLSEKPISDKRMLAIAKTKFQEAFMWMNRSIEQPVDFFVNPESK